MEETNSKVAELLSHQNPDGGWGYKPGPSWTEPTCYALLALSAVRYTNPKLAAGYQWLRATQRPDGGWAPSTGVDESTWVTSVASLALAASPPDAARHQQALRWLILSTGAESGWLEKFRRRMLGVPASLEAAPAWPWYPGTSCWVAPTALSLLALRGCRLDGAESRIAEGRRFLLRRRCSDGAWNHGGASYRSDNAASYPETTGLALLALRGCTGPELAAALTQARKLLLQPCSAEGRGWLLLGLRAHGEKAGNYETNSRCWTVPDLALTLLSSAPSSLL